MGKRNKRQKRRTKSSDDPSEISGNTQVKQSRGYSDIVKENSSFEVYYKAQGIVPEDEWNSFMTSLRDGLPAAFRITGYRGQAKAMLKIIKGQYFENLLNIQVEGEQMCKPLCLSWYPDDLAWQLKLSRVVIRKSEEFTRLHSFLVSETDSGNISRQETVSMIPPLLLDVHPHHKVLDMCAAPGSKTAQVIEMLHREENAIPEGVIIANDVDNKRCYMLVHQAKRLDSPCFIITNHDAAQMPNLKVTAKDGSLVTVKYDRILCDVPCSGDGTIRKNVDIWRKWNVGNGNNLHGLQFRIAKRGLELLVLGGKMVYSTCSLNPIEDEAVISSLLTQSEGAVELVDVSSQLPGLKTCPGVSQWKVMNRNLHSFTTFEDVPEKNRTQIRPNMFPPSGEKALELHLDRCIRILPHHQDTGGFFVAVLKKVKEHLPWEQNCGSYDVKVNEEQKSGPPPLKKRRIWGYKEDPFIFFNDEDVWPSIRDFYNLDSRFPHEQLLSRCQVSKKRNLYFVSKMVKDIVQHNIDHVKIINTGVRLLCRSDNKDASCAFRLTQQGIPTILPYLQSRIINVPVEDLVLLLTDEFPANSRFTSEVQAQMNCTGSGCVVLVYTANKGLEDEFRIELCGWKGKNTLRCYAPKNQRLHYLRMCGVDVSQYEKKDKKFKIKLSEQETVEDNIDEKVQDSSDIEDHPIKNDDGTSEANKLHQCGSISGRGDMIQNGLKVSETVNHLPDVRTISTDVL